MNKINSLSFFGKMKTCHAEIRFPLLLLCYFLLASHAVDAKPSDTVQEESDKILQTLKQWQQQPGWQQLRYTAHSWIAGGAENLPDCQQPVRHELAKRSAQPWGTYQFRFTCEQPAWTFRARIEVSASLPVWTLASQVKKGQVIRANDLQLMPVELDKVRGQVTDSTKNWIGYRAKRSLSAGVLLQEKDLLPPLWVHKGDIVLMKVQAEGMQATTKGEALHDGVAQAAIDVKNLHSEKIVQGKVTNPGEVTIQY